MTFFLFYSTIVLLVYLTFILFAISKVKPPVKNSQPVNTKHHFAFSIIIPFRNEAENLTNILSDLEQLNFDKNRFEVIFIDDGSTDGSFGFLEKQEFLNNFRLIKASSDGKKQAIIEAISLASGNYIYSTDADCRLHPDILKQADEILCQNQTKLIVQPVLSTKSNNLLGQFQYYDFLSLMGINTAVYNLNGVPAIASAANLIFNKAAFEALMPFNNNLHISSGDDMFLLKSFLKADPQSVILNYRPESLVITKAETNWVSFIKQRIRWAGKMKHFNGSTSFFLGALSVAVQVALIGFLMMGFINSYYFALVFIGIWVLKSVLDYSFFYKIGILLGKKTKWITVFILEPVYMVIVPLILLLSLFIHPQWKGRKIAH
jgi:cellulose synthase/poly-beta-1,6-N-acetylglucosamine synthase-like glycosyltransferase